MSHDLPAAEPGWVHGHSHDPNPEPPPGDATIAARLPDGATVQLSVATLRALPYREIGNCYIVSTGHGTSGPFVFGGVTLADLLVHLLPTAGAWRQVDVVSGDGFGTRLTPADLAEAPAGRPPLLAYKLDGAEMTRQAGLVRLVVPAETDDALKQVKWIARLEIR